MRVRWWRQLVGRSLLRERAGRRSRAIGACPSCGDVLSGPSEGWLDAEHVMAEHLVACIPPAAAATVHESIAPRRAPQTLRLA
jgi:hypothetical protein